MTAGSTPERDLLVDYLRRQLIGPWNGEFETLPARDKPHARYLMGTLYPQGAVTQDTLEDEELEGAQGSSDAASTDDPIALAQQQMPASLGLSFLVDEDAVIEVAVGAGIYQLDGKWQREPLTDRFEVPALPRAPQPGQDLLGGRASAHAVRRPMPDGSHLITITLVNKQSAEGARGRSELCLFQVSLICTLANGSFRRYPAALRPLDTDEERAGAMLYRGVPIWAIGHGCSASWEGEEAGAPTAVRTTFMPEETVAGITFEIPEIPRAVLSFNELADAADRGVAAEKLEILVRAYEEWFRGLEARHADIPASMNALKTAHLDEIRAAITRMRDGIACIDTHADVACAFALSNRAMLIQRRNSAADRAGSPHARGQEGRQPDYANAAGEWRPFQLAFILSTLRGIAENSAEQRDVLDLIWFPTGGGKTEAYLGLVAFTLFYRRLRFGAEGDGTAVITRYTLRLLTAQQFQRAAMLIVACEWLRQQHDALEGSPFSIGLWVGGEVTPNSRQKAAQLLEELKENGPPPMRTFGISRCPWCGTELIPESVRGTPEFREASRWGVTCSNAGVRIHCPSEDCHFHEGLPVRTVDPDLYDDPPSMIVGTLDKFAAFAWRAEPGVFMGREACRPPDLIIQDELHLIGGPLGSIAGLYEMAFDFVLRRRGARPKVIASTATISRAGEQAAALFDRATRIFPPPGLSADDSFFMKADSEIPGRHFVGVMDQAHSPITANVHTTAAMLQSVMSSLPADPARDEYWTLVAYQNSTREHGKSMTLAADDIPSRIKAIEPVKESRRALPGSGYTGLISTVRGARVSETLDQLEIARVDGALDLLITTNMFATGIDVPRLGLMLMNGQPKSTSEYIQATSRVGRSYPGLIVSLYSGAKPRDRSHYERFRAYHSSLYRHVEAVSVTPFSPRARERALHAALVIMVRHGLGLTDDTAASEFDRDLSGLTEAHQHIINLVRATDATEEAGTARQLDELIIEWSDRAERAKSAGDVLRFNDDGGGPTLLIGFEVDARRGGWRTLWNMRSVDSSVLVDAQEPAHG